VGDLILEAVRSIFLDAHVLGVILLSAVYGIFIGSIPGLTATMAVALMVPVMYYLTPLEALAAVVTLEACAIFAGDIPGALIRMPGTPSSAAYADDLYALSRQKGPSRPLGVSLVFSVASGIFGGVVLMFLAKPLARFATSFSYPEYFWFYLIGLGCAVVVSRGSPLRGALALLLGLLFSTVGMSSVHSQPRFTFGREELEQGINFIPAMIGLFGFSEVLRNLMTVGRTAGETVAEAEGPEGQGFWGRWVVRPWMSVFRNTIPLLWARKFKALLASSIGALVGILPGAGADIAAWVSYGVSKKLSRKPEEYGKGSLEGVIDSGSANNAALGGAWVPTLVFGIPGDSITAIVIGIMMMKNVRPGPRIFEEQPTTVYGLYLIFILANLLLVPVGFLAIKAGSRLIRVPRRILIPAILISCIIGSFSIQLSLFDVWVMMGFGLLGFFLERRQIPLGPVVLGIVLGGPLEETFIQTMTAAKNPWSGLFGRPIAAVLAGLCLLLWLSPLAGRLWRRGRSKAGAAPPETIG
jgi:TctA family transporter